MEIYRKKHTVHRLTENVSAEIVVVERLRDLIKKRSVVAKGKKMVCAAIY